MFQRPISKIPQLYEWMRAVIWSAAGCERCAHVRIERWVKEFLESCREEDAVVFYTLRNRTLANNLRQGANSIRYDVKFNGHIL